MVNACACVCACFTLRTCIYGKCMYTSEWKDVQGKGTYCFSGAVGSDNEGEGFEEGDNVGIFGTETAYALYQHLVDGTHLGRDSQVEEKRQRRGRVREREEGQGLHNRQSPFTLQ